MQVSFLLLPPFVLLFQYFSFSSSSPPLTATSVDIATVTSDSFSSSSSTSNGLHHFFTRIVVAVTKVLSSNLLFLLFLLLFPFLLIALSYSSPLTHFISKILLQHVHGVYLTKCLKLILLIKCMVNWIFWWLYLESLFVCVTL